VLQRRDRKEATRSFKLADHSIELSTRNVIATEWTGLKIRCSVCVLVDMGEGAVVSGLLSDSDVGRY
jgi:hypothetical protein